MKFRELGMESGEWRIEKGFVILNAVKNLKGLREVGEGCE